MALRSRRHGWLVLNVFRLIMVRSRLFGASTAAAIVGLVAITVYLVVERAVANRLPVVLCLQQLLQWDASNAYGPRAFSGGWPTALVGLAMDFVVSLAWAAVFTVLYWKIPTVRRDVVPAGIAVRSRRDGGDALRHRSLRSCSADAEHGFARHQRARGTHALLRPTAGCDGPVRNEEKPLGTRPLESLDPDRPEGALMHPWNEGPPAVRAVAAFRISSVGRAADC